MTRLTIYRDGWTGGLQLAIEDMTGGGYRILGPKFNGSSEELATRELDAARDIAELRRYLDRTEAALADDGVVIAPVPATAVLRLTLAVRPIHSAGNIALIPVGKALVSAVSDRRYTCDNGQVVQVVGDVDVEVTL